MRFLEFLRRTSLTQASFKLLLPVLIAICLHPGVLAGNDVLILKNGDRITGEVQRLELGELFFDPDYGNGVFRFDWEDVERIESQATFIARTSGGSRVVGTLSNDPEDASRILIETESETIDLEHMEVVKLQQLEEGFLARVDFDLDVGITLTKADETKQFTTRSSFAYLAERWSAEAGLNILRNIREDSDTTRRTEFGGSYRRSMGALGDRWYGIGGADFLQSNELQLDLRSTLTGGVGNYLVRTNRVLVSADGGVAWTNERYEDPATPIRDSGEAYGTIEVKLFGISDLDVFSSLAVFPSLTESGRVRVNFDTDLRWEFIDDFYISLGFTENFDSDPPPDILTRSDYIFSTSVGWSY